MSGAAVPGHKAVCHAAYSTPSIACILLAAVLPFRAPVLPAGGFALPDYLGGLEECSECFDAMSDAAAPIGDAPAERQTLWHFCCPPDCSAWIDVKRVIERRLVCVTATGDLRPVFGQVIAGSIRQLRGQVCSVPQCCGGGLVVFDYSVAHVTPFRPTELSQEGFIVAKCEGTGQCGFTFGLRAQMSWCLAVLATSHQRLQT